MRRALTLFVLTVFCLASWQDLTVWSLYAVSKSYIVQTFCVNTDRPELHCDGKCHMKERFAEDNTDPDQERLPEVERVELLPVQLADGAPMERILRDGGPVIHPRTFYRLERVTDLLDPPQTMV